MGRKAGGVYHRPRVLDYRNKSLNLGKTFYCRIQGGRTLWELPAKPEAFF